MEEKNRRFTVLGLPNLIMDTASHIRIQPPFRLAVYPKKTCDIVSRFIWLMNQIKKSITVILLQCLCIRTVCLWK